MCVCGAGGEGRRVNRYKKGKTVMMDTQATLLVKPETTHKPVHGSGREGRRKRKQGDA